MKKVNYLVLAEDVIVGDDGSITLVKVFNALVTDKFPASPQMSVAFAFPVPQEHKDKEVLMVHVEFTTLKDELIAKFKAKVTQDLKGPQPPEGMSMEVVSDHNVSGKVEFKQSGVYKLKLFCEGEELTDIRFEVEKQK